MPLIEFPDIPQLEGVPDLNKAAVGVAVLSGVAAQIEKYDYLNRLFDKQDRPKQVRQWEGQWGIYNKKGEIALICDSIVTIDFKKESQIASHPVEKGGFASYNKIARPYDIDVLMTCGGQKGLSREAFLLTCQEIADSISLFDVVTPDLVHENVNMVGFNFSRKSQSGVSLLTVEAYFTEVRETAIASYSRTRKPDGTQMQSSGAASVKPASKELLAIAK